MTRRPAGDGHIRMRPNGRYEGVITLRDGSKKSVSGGTRAEVADRLKVLRDADEQGLKIAPKATVADAIKVHKEHLATRVKLGTLKASTEAWYIDMLKHAEPLEQKLLKDLRPTDIEKWQAAMTSAPSTRRGAFTALKAALGTARRDGLTASDPFKGVHTPAATRLEEPAVAHVDDALKIAGKMEAPWKQVALTLAYTGMRRSEALALRWVDVDLDNRILWVRAGKTARSRRTLPMAEPLAEALEALPRSSAWVFPSRADTQLDPRNFNRKFAEAATAAGYSDVTPHGLRHGAATRMLESGIPVHVVSALLGHASVTVTLDTYAHSISSIERQAIDVLGGSVSGSAEAVQVVDPKG